MTKSNATWYLKDSSTPYSGKFIDYYLTGSKQGEGVLFNGKLKGKRILYHQNGTLSDEIEYENGISNGIEKRFYGDGILNVDYNTEFNPFKGKKHTDETKLRMSLKARQRTPEQNSQYGTIWITDGSDNRKIKKLDKIPEGWYKGRKN